MFAWTPESIGFSAAAGEHTDYYPALAARLLPYLTGAGHICDAGCGLGYLSRALAAHIPHITAIDCDPAALAVLQEHCPRQVTPLCADVLTHIPPAPYDAMVFCFFGHIAQILPLAARHCRGKALILARNYAQHRFSAAEHPIGGHSYASYVRYLEHCGIPYTQEVFSLECGQPLRSQEEARRFFTLYRQPGDPPVTDDFLRSRLTSADDREFPLYAGQEREIGLLCLEADTIRDLMPDPMREGQITD